MLLNRLFKRTLWWPRSLNRKLTERDLIEREARIGGQLFGQVPAGRVRQFFCLDDHTWVWYEEWTDRNGLKKRMSTFYEVRPNGILKVQDGLSYQFASDEEVNNLIEAARLYDQYVSAYLYNRQPLAI